jgi:hypothetical protein
VFYKDEAGRIFHTCSTFGRRDEQFMTTYGFLDVTPKGRNEGPRHNLMDWVRPHNMYGKGGSVARGGRYHAASCGCSAHGCHAPFTPANAGIQSFVSGSFAAQPGFIAGENS